MTVALQDLPVQSKFTAPSGIVTGSFDTKSGLLPSSLTPTAFISTEIAAEGDFPTRVSDVWIQKDVAKDHPNMLAPSDSENTLTKTFLNLPGRDSSWTWPQNEAPYKPPTETAPTSPDPLIEPPITTDPALDASALPSPVLKQVEYNSKTSHVVIPMSNPPGSDNYPVILFIQRPDQPIGSISLKNSMGSLSFSLVLNNKTPQPGDYLFWASFQDPKGSGVGPSSNIVKLKLT